MKLKNNTWVLDSTDVSILESLQENANQTYTAIGKRLGIAHSTVYDRIRRMELQGVIRKYTVMLDAEKVGLDRIVALMTVFTDPKETDRVAEKLSQAPRVLDVYTSLSEELLIIAKVSAENQESLHKFIADYVAPLPGVLRIRTSIVTRKFKETQFSISEDPKKLTLALDKRSRTGASSREGRK